MLIDVKIHPGGFDTVALIVSSIVAVATVIVAIIAIRTLIGTIRDRRDDRLRNRLLEVLNWSTSLGIVILKSGPIPLSKEQLRDDLLEVLADGSLDLINSSILIRDESKFLKDLTELRMRSTYIEGVVKNVDQFEAIVNETIRFLRQRLTLIHQSVDEASVIAGEPREYREALALGCNRIDLYHAIVDLNRIIGENV